MSRGEVKTLLRKLGEALLDKCAPPDGCPDYGAVMLWHNDLASEVSSDKPWPRRQIGGAKACR